MTEIIAKPGAEIQLGRWDEHLARCVVFDISQWRQIYGEGTVQLLHQRCGDSAPYPCAVEVTGTQVRWTVSETDVALSGRGCAELRYYVGETRVKSEIYHTRTKQSMGNAGMIPDEPSRGWVEQVLDAALRAEQAAGKGPVIQNGTWWVWDAEKQQYTDTEVTAAVGASGDLEERVEELEGRMADLLYTPINITSFTHNAGTREMGDTVTEVKLSWSVNKQPSALTLDGESLSASQISQTLSSLSITKDSGKTWTLKATDERGAVSTKSTGISFQNGIYYGCAAVPETVHSAFVMGLEQKILSGNKNRTVTFSGGDSLYAWYCYPKRLGLSLFNIGGFDYDYEYITVPFTNQFGVTEDYYVYRSGQYVPTPISVTVKNGG